MSFIICFTLSLSVHGALRIDSAIAGEGDPEVQGIDPGDFVTISFSEAFTTPVLSTHPAQFTLNSSSYSVNSIIIIHGGQHTWTDYNNAIGAASAWSTVWGKPVLTIYLSSGAVTAAVGDQLRLGPNASAVFQTTADTTSSTDLIGSFNGSQPSLVSVSPNNEAIGIAPNITVGAIFNENMTAVPTGALELYSIRNNQGTLFPSEGELVNGSVARDTTDLKKLIYTPHDNLKNNYTYRIIISHTQSKDIAGNTLEGEKNIVRTFSIYMDYTEDNIVVGSDENTQISLGSHAFSENGYIAISTHVATARYEDAHDAAELQGDPFGTPLTGTIREFIAYKTSGDRYVEDFGNTVTITIPFPDHDNDGFVDNTSPLVREESLALWRLSESTDEWIRVKGSKVKSSDNTVEAVISSLADNRTVYIIKGRAETNLDEPYCYPNPFKPNSDLGHTDITFANLSPSPEPVITIYTISGRLVKKLESDSNSRDRIRIWDVTNNSGKKVASGIYIYILDNGTELKKGKLVIIR